MKILAACSTAIAIVSFVIAVATLMQMRDLREEISSRAEGVAKFNEVIARTVIVEDEFTGQRIMLGSPNRVSGSGQISIKVTTPSGANSEISPDGLIVAAGDVRAEVRPERIQVLSTAFSSTLTRESFTINSEVFQQPSLRFGITESGAGVLWCSNPSTGEMGEFQSRHLGFSNPKAHSEFLSFLGVGNGNGGTLFLSNHKGQREFAATTGHERGSLLLLQDGASKYEPRIIGPLD